MTEARINSAAGDERVREQEHFIGEEATEGETQRPDVPVSIAFGIAPQILDRQQPEHAKPDASKELRTVPALGRVYDEQVTVVADSRDAEYERSEEVEPPEPGGTAGASRHQRNCEQQPCGQPEAVKRRQDRERLIRRSAGCARPSDRSKAAPQDGETGLARPATHNH